MRKTTVIKSHKITLNLMDESDTVWELEGMHDRGKDDSGRCEIPLG